MAAWRRGNEAPMQWEFTNQPTTSSTISSPQEQAQQQQQQPTEPTAPPPSDSPIEDESMRDASMLSPHDEDDNNAGSSSTTPAQALVRRNRRGSSSSIVSIRRSDEPNSLSSSSQHHQHQHQQWPLAPVVGTVINYLVPPLPQKDSTTDSVASLRRPPRAPSPSSSSSSAQQRAHATLHPREKPLLLLSYAQLTFNASLLLIALYVVFALVYTIRLDVVERLSEIEESYHAGIATCRRSYELNCLSVPLPPALVAACDEWKNCANKRLTDVLGGSRLRVVIEVLSEAWEAGVAGLGWRTLAFSLLVLSLVIGGTNSTLTSWRLGVLKSSRRERRGERSRRQQQMQAPTITGGSGSGDEDDSFAAAGGASSSSNAYAPPPPPNMQAYPASYPASPNGLHPAYHHQQYLAAQYHHAAGAYGNPYAAQQHYMSSSSPPPSPLRKQASNVSLLSAGSAGSAGSGGGGGGGRSGKGKRRKGWMSGMLGRKSSSRRARLGADSGQSAGMLQPSRGGGSSSGGEWIDE